LIAAEFTPGSAADKRAARDDAAIKVALHFNNSDLPTFRRKAQHALNGQMTFHWPLEFPEVMVERGGFDAFVGNPPFMGGTVAKSVLGESYKKFIANVFGQCHGNSDIAAWFFRNAACLLRKTGAFGFLGSDSIGEGDTRETGLLVLIANGFTIYEARSSFDWPGTAAVKASITIARLGPYCGLRTLDEQQVDYISSRLDDLSVEEPPPILLHRGPDFILGTKVYGEGFVLSGDEFVCLQKDDPISATVVQPYQTGSDLNSTPDQSGTRWVINFGNMPIAEAIRFKLAFARVETLVKPERESSATGKARSEWWKYERPRPELYSRISGKKRVLAKAKTSSTFAFAWVDSARVFADGIFVSPDATPADFAIVSSSLYEQWATLFCSTLKGDMRFASSDLYDNFPFPTNKCVLRCVGEEYDGWRSSLTKARQEGITAIYNRVHNPEETSADIQKLRELHAEMDYSVAKAYGWVDIALGHGFHETKQGVRYTISEPARREVLARLLKLNHERYAEEVKQGLHEKKKGSAKKPTTKKTAAKPVKDTATLFDMQEEDE
jgi:hypothetical protein